MILSASWILYKWKEMDTDIVWKEREGLVKAFNSSVSGEEEFNLVFGRGERNSHERDQYSKRLELMRDAFPDFMK